MGNNITGKINTGGINYVDMNEIKKQVYSTIERMSSTIIKVDEADAKIKTAVKNEIATVLPSELDAKMPFTLGIGSADNVNQCGYYDQGGNFHPFGDGLCLIAGYLLTYSGYNTDYNFAPFDFRTNFAVKDTLCSISTTGEVTFLKSMLVDVYVMGHSTSLTPCTISGGIIRKNDTTVPVTIECVATTDATKAVPMASGKIQSIHVEAGDTLKWLTCYTKKTTTGNINLQCVVTGKPI